MTDTTTVGELTAVPVDKVVPVDVNRREWGDLDGLASSMAADGLVSPIVVRPHPDGDGRWQLVAGERRLRAAVMLGWVTIEALAADRDDEAADAARWVENVQRLAWTPREEAEQLQAMMARRGWSQTQAAGRLGLSQPTVSKRLALLRLPDAVHDELEAGEITLEDAAALVPLADHPDRLVDALSRKGPLGLATTVRAAAKDHTTVVERDNERRAAFAKIAERGQAALDASRCSRPEQLMGTYGAAVLGGAGYGHVDVAPGVHSRTCDHHVVAVLASGKTAPACAKPGTHHAGNGADGGAVRTGQADQLRLTGEDADLARQRDREEGDAKAWRDAHRRRLEAAASRLAGRPALGDTIVRTLPAILHAFPQSRLRIACRLLDVAPAKLDRGGHPVGRDYAGALVAHAADDPPHTAARVLLALMVAVAEDGTSTLPSASSRARWLAEHADYLDWLGLELAEVEARHLDQHQQEG